MSASGPSGPLVILVSDLIKLPSQFLDLNTIIFILIIAHALIIALPLVWTSKIAIFWMIFGNFKAS